ncbi:MAG: 1-deoxy-D-xylulose-5-phosphate reductoisomerase, partial [Ignavibacteriaceae bacterium]
MKKVLILGSTGSIGVNTLNVIRNFPDHFKITALTVNSNTELLIEQVNEFKPELVVVTDNTVSNELKEHIPAGCT